MKLSTDLARDQTLLHIPHTSDAIGEGAVASLQLKRVVGGKNSDRTGQLIGWSLSDNPIPARFRLLVNQVGASAQLNAVNRDLQMFRNANFAKLLLASSALFAVPAFAQAQEVNAAGDVQNSSTGAPEPDGSDIIVTARKIAEPLSKAPVAVTALTQEQLRTKEVRNPQDLNIAVPSLLVSGQFVGGRDVAQYSIRGLGAAGGAVATYFAGAPGGGGQQQFYDLANVQVIAGQQGTLFGRTSTSGAILFEPNRPTFEFDGFVQAGIGTLDYNRLEGMINVPIIDDVLAVRAAGFRLRRNGYTKSLTTGQDLDDQHRESFRIGVQFNPFGDLLNTYTVFQYNNLDENGIGSVLQDIDTANTTGMPPVGYFSTPLAPGFTLGDAFFGAACNGDAARYGLTGATAGAFYGGCIAQRSSIYEGYRAQFISERDRIASGARGGIRSVANSGLQEVHSRRFTLVNNSVLNLGDVGPLANIALKNVFSYQWGKGTYGRFEDTDGIPGFAFDSGVADYNGPTAGICSTSGPTIGQCTFPDQGRPYSGKQPTQISDEVNLTAKLFDRLDLLAGYFYLKGKSYPGGAGGGGYTFSNTLNVGFAPTFTTRSQGSWNTEEGWFVNGSLDLDFLIPNVKVGAGYRRTKVASETLTQVVTPSYDPATGAATLAIGPTSSTTTGDTGSNYQFSIDWQPTDNILIYARHGSGFTPGGANVRCDNPDTRLANGATALANGQDCPATFNKQSAKDYELGAKVQWGIGDARMNTTAAMYQTDFTDIVQQIRTTSTITRANVLYSVNAPAARIKGFELTQNVRYQGLGLQLTYSYIDSKYTKYYEAGTGKPCTNPNNANNDCLVLSGQRLIAAVKHRFGASVDWTLPVPERLGTITPSLQVSYGSSANYGRTLQQDPGSVAPGYTLVHGRVDWRNVGGHPVDLSLFVRNIFDKTYVTYVAPLYSIFGFNTAQYGEPRTAGIELRYRFGAGARR
jgi:iron complex outermembrane recepter protein